MRIFYSPHKIKAFVLTGEKRLPKKGEWFISGAIPEAYKACADHHLGADMHIAREITKL